MMQMLRFRPLPGLLSSQCSLSYEGSAPLILCPSPSGASIFSMVTFLVGNKKFGRCFRPLPGLLSSQYSFGTDTEPWRSVSVPFRGFYLLNPPPPSPLFKPVPAPLCGGKKFLAILPEKTASKKPATPVLMGCAGKITRCTPTVQFCTVPSGNFFHDIWYISMYAEMHHIPCHGHVYDLLEHPY